MPQVPTTHLLSKLRKLFGINNSLNPIHAYIITSNDCHTSEYTSDSDKRRQFISGFAGSAGTAVITPTGAFLWTDPRYFLEAKDCLDENWHLMKLGLPETPSILDWLKKLPHGSVVGTDPHYLSYTQWKIYQKELSKSGKSFVAVKENLVDIVWREEGKPMEILSQPYIYKSEYSGQSWHKKVKSIRKLMIKNCVDVLVVSALDEIAWLFNLRGSDIHCCPVFKSFAIVTINDIYLFIDSMLVSSAVMEHLNLSQKVGKEFAIIRPYLSITETIKDLAHNCARIWIDNSTPAFLVIDLPKNKLMIETNPINIQKAIKNETELQNLRKTCIRDAACLCEYFGYLEQNIVLTKITEVDGSNYLLSLRSKMPNFIMNSFDTISSVGSNAAVIHYHPKDETAKIIEQNQIYLCDSGGHYFDGTTDITRTLHFGTPTEQEKTCYTLVLKGHISLATAIFPSGCSGSRIDSFARQHLWKEGLDYLHGTGHGIGMFLSVHEGPQRISSTCNDSKFEVGNVLSNEPGYYEDGKFGIRIEGMMSVTPISTKYNFNKTEFLGFEMLSFVPMHMNLINPSLLTIQEKIWLNNYNKKCVELTKSELDKHGFSAGLDYLHKNTQELPIE